MKLKDKKALIFDLDGCLLDTSPGIKESVTYTLNTLGMNIPNDSELEKFIGPPIQASLQEFCNLTPEEAQSGADIFRGHYKDEALLKATLYPGIIAALKELKGRGLRLAVATYKREDYALTLLDSFGLTNYFDIIHGGDNLNKLTKSDIIELCLSDMECSKDRAVMIGDTLNDARGAENLKMDFIGVTWGFGFKTSDYSIPCKNLAMIDTPQQLLSIFEP